MKKSELKKIIIDEIKSILNSDTVVENINVSSIEMDVLKNKLNKVIDKEGAIGVNSQDVVQYTIGDNPKNALFIGKNDKGSFYVMIADIMMETEITKPVSFNTFASAMLFAEKLANKFKSKLK